MISFEDFQRLDEVRIIGKGQSEDPLRDDETIRVYHGAFDIETVVGALKYGLTGDTRASRRFSYEANNNPKGLFVTPDLPTAKEFGDYIIEFHTRVRDLSAPVWPGGSFTGQGGYAGSFDSDEERDIAKAAQKARISKEAAEYIVRSDSPDVAYWLMGVGERQALFMGSLNSNSIRAIWVKNEPDRALSSVRRMSPRDFMREFEDMGVKNRFGSRSGPDSIDQEKIRKLKQKLVEPRENVTLDTLVSRYLEKYEFLKRERLLKILKDNPDYIEKALWNSKQIASVKREINKLR